MSDARGVERTLPVEATAFLLDAEIVDRCLDEEKPTDRLFLTAFASSLSSVDPSERRGSLAGVTGHVAESVVELLLDDLGYHMLWHFAGPGRHGVDLVALCPAGERVVAVEVKGTLRSGHWPRLSTREIEQMSAAWIDKRDNPGMANWDLTSNDVYGAVFLVNFADLSYRAAFTSDLKRLRAISAVEQLADLSWLAT